MKVMTSYYTDIGVEREINQDSFLVKVADSSKGTIVFATVCDGMGGLSKGELASKEAVMIMNHWFYTTLPKMIEKSTIPKEWIFNEWKQQIDLINKIFRRYAKEKGIEMGTTLSALLLYQNRYYIGHIGDSRVYRIAESIQQITEDDTLVAWEVKMGMISKEQGKADPRKNILLRCLGSFQEAKLQFVSGVMNEDTTFVLCSDGFSNNVTQEEILQNMKPENLIKKRDIARACRELSYQAMRRGERDNITVVGMVVRTERS